MWQGEPFTIALTRCTLGFQVLLEERWEWETLLPNVTPLPQTEHFAIGKHPLVSLETCKKHYKCYYNTKYGKKQVFFQIFSKNIFPDEFS